MRQVAVRELNQDTAGVLARVQFGEEVEVTSNGRPIARLVPILDHPLATLLRDGAVQPARRAVDLMVSAADEAAEGAAHAGLAAAISADRDERL